MSFVLFILCLKFLGVTEVEIFRMQLVFRREYCFEEINLEVSIIQELIKVRFGGQWLRFGVIIGLFEFVF